MRVLVVEDQAEMAEMVATGLRRAQMAVDVALDGPSGLERALINDYDVLVSTATCRVCTATRSVCSSSRRGAAAGC